MTDTLTTNTARWDAIDVRLHALDGGTPTSVSYSVSVGASAVTHTEGNSGTVGYSHTVTRTGFACGFTVDWAVTGSGTYPANATDFGGTLPSGTLTFTASDTTKTISYTVSGDTTVENNETFTVTLSNLTNDKGASIGTSAVTGNTITNDDSSVTWPDDEYDARFSSNVAAWTSGQSYAADMYYSGGSPQIVWQNLDITATNYLDFSCGVQNYKLLNCRILDVPEGPRIGGANVTIEGCYIRIGNTSSGDHGDGTQVYTGNSGGSLPDTTSNIIIKNSKIVMTAGSNNAAFFSGDSSGVQVTFENVYVDGRNCPNGAIWLPNDAYTSPYHDIGCKSVSATNVVVRADTGCHGFTTQPNGHGFPYTIYWDNTACTVGTWSNVRWSNGTAITSPNDSSGTSAP